MYTRGAGLLRTPDVLTEVALGHQTENEDPWAHRRQHVAVGLALNQRP